MKRLVVPLALAIAVAASLVVARSSLADDDHLITVTLDNVPVSDVLRMLSRLGNFTFTEEGLTEEQLSRITITVHVENVPATEDTVNAILKPAGLKVEKTAKGLKVVRIDRRDRGE
jgi:hypothetical protein